MMVGLAFALEIRGRLAEALETAESAVEAARLADNPQMTSFALLAETWTAAMSGNLEQAVRAGEEALTSIEGLDESVLTRANRETVAAAFIEAGDPERGLRLAHLAGAPEFPHVDPGRRCWLYALLCQAELAGGRRAAAEDWLVPASQPLPDWHSRVGMPRCCTRARCCSCTTAGRATGRHGEHGDRACRQRRRCHPERSLACVACSALGRAGQREEAVALLREAEATPASNGAHDCAARRPASCAGSDAARPLASAAPRAARAWTRSAGASARSPTLSPTVTPTARSPRGCFSPRRRSRAISQASSRSLASPPRPSSPSASAAHDRQRPDTRRFAPRCQAAGAVATSSQTSSSRSGSRRSPSRSSSGPRSPAPPGSGGPRSRRGLAG